MTLSSRIGVLPYLFSLSSLALGCSSADGETLTGEPGAEAVSEATPGRSEAQRKQDAFGSGAFVKTKGTEFELDGRPFYFQGTNFYQLGLSGPFSDSQIYQGLKTLKDKGLDVVRFWAFSCDGSIDQFHGRTVTPMIREFKVGQVSYNEEALVQLDTALDAARSAGVKLVLTLVNFEPEVCGMDMWVKKLKNSDDKQLFYTDKDVVSTYKKHVETLLNRTNTKYRDRFGIQVAYKDDPTILAIETSNEPHTVDGYEKDQGKVPGKIVHAWLRDMTDFIRTKDTNHLISTGEEGYKVSHSGDSAHGWIHDGLKGVDFEANVKLPNVDFATVHLYPDNWEIPASSMEWVRVNLVKDRAAIAHAAGKPIVLEEAGFNTAWSPDSKQAKLGYTGRSVESLRLMYKFANEAGYAGTMVWQALPTGFGAAGYQFEMGAPEFAVVEAQAKCMRSKSNGQNDCKGINY